MENRVTAPIQKTRALIFIGGDHFLEKTTEKKHAFDLKKERGKKKNMGRKKRALL